MNNKYNVRAIRNELDSYIRNNAWRKFRKRIVSLLSNTTTAVTKKTSPASMELHCFDIDNIKDSLCRDVIEYRKCSHNNGKMTRNSLLHVLCSRYNASSENPVPMDIIELFCQLCPIGIGVK